MLTAAGLNPNLPDWELYPKPRFEYPLKPAKTLVDASKATRAIVRIFFIFSSIAILFVISILLSFKKPAIENNFSKAFVFKHKINYVNMLYSISFN